ncbi:MAG: DUF302 domain-containing protein [Hyphomicrobiaceae bacterium]|nr:DUF302 domain-containing protein [Hyphomicrobiaceae bacterium]
MSKSVLHLVAGAFLAAFISLFAFAAPAAAGEVEKRGEAYVIYLPGELDFYEVFGRLQSEISAANWEITNIQNIDTGLMQYGVKIQNKVISACKSQLLAQAIKEDPFISLAVPCRFTIFKDDSTGKLVIGFNDPAAEAKALGIKNHAAAGQATEELKTVLKTMLDFYGK